MTSTNTVLYWQKNFRFAVNLTQWRVKQVQNEPGRRSLLFYDNCKKQIPGKKGFPRFEKDNRSVEYKSTGWRLAENRKSITFTDKKGIGTLKLKGTRDLHFYQPNQIKRVRLVKRADGYHVQFCISVDRSESIEVMGAAIGLDVGLNHFYTDSNNQTVENPRFLRQGERRLKWLKDV